MIWERSPALISVAMHKKMLLEVFVLRFYPKNAGQTFLW
jgi:hypothetical protein